MKPILSTYHKTENTNLYIQKSGFHKLLPEQLYVSKPVQSQLNCEWVLYKEFNNIVSGLRSFYEWNPFVLNEKKVGYIGNVVNKNKRSLILVFFNTTTLKIALYVNKYPRKVTDFAQIEYSKFKRNR